MARKPTSRKTKISREKAEALLFPVAAFLNDGGLSREESVKILYAAYERAAKTLNRLLKNRAFAPK